MRCFVRLTLRISLHTSSLSDGRRIIQDKNDATKYRWNMDRLRKLAETSDLAFTFKSSTRRELRQRLEALDPKDAKTALTIVLSSYTTWSRRSTEAKEIEAKPQRKSRRKQETTTTDPREDVTDDEEEEEGRVLDRFDDEDEDVSTAVRTLMDLTCKLPDVAAGLRDRDMSREVVKEG